MNYWTVEDKAEILSESTKPPVIKNGNWYVYDVESKEYIDTLTAATGPAGQDGKTALTASRVSAAPQVRQDPQGQRVSEGKLVRQGQPEPMAKRQPKAWTTGPTSIKPR